jgi:hypothetical protein
MENDVSEFDLRVRFEVYRFFLEHCRAPVTINIASVLNAEAEEVRLAFHRLHGRHMLFLEPGGDAIRMANPFSAVPTPFRVHAGERAWWANCAWDTLGIAAATGLDVNITAHYPDSQEAVLLEVRNGKVDGRGHQVYFPLPFRSWYDDLVFT